MKLKDYFKQLKIDLAPMTFGQKMDHIWTYNKELILIIIGALVLIIGLLVTFLTKPDVVFSGFMLNVKLSDEGTAYLTTDYRDIVDPSGKKTVELNTGTFNSKDTTNADETSYSNLMKIMALCSDQSLDYLITDEDALLTMAVNEICMDMTEFFSEEEFAQWKDKIFYAELEDGTSYPVGVDISETDFAKSCVTSKGKVYWSVVANTKNSEMCHEFWNYILDWK